MPASDLYVVMPWFGTFAGGAPAALTSIAEAIAACGLKVSILTSCSKSPYMDWQNEVHDPGVEHAGAIEVRRFAVDRGDSSDYHLAARRRMGGETVEVDLQEAFFLQGLNSSPLVDFVAALPPGVPVLAGPYFQALVPSLVNGCPGRVTVMPAFHDEPELRWAPIQRMIRNARGFLFLSDEEKALAIRIHGAHGGRRLVEAPISGLGVSLPAALSDAEALEEASLRASIRLGLPERYFLYCGRIEEGKGLDYLIPWYRRWAQLRAASAEEAIPLVLVGGGNPGVVPDSPEFLHVGFIDAADKFAVMRGAVGLVNPSRMESFSYVVMESWLTGRPVIVPAQCEVTAGHVRRSRGGLEFSDEISFRAVLDALLDEKECLRLGEAGRAYVHRNYAWPEVLDRVLAGLDLAAA